MKSKETITVVFLMMALVIVWQPVTYRIGKWLGYDMDAMRQAATQPATTQPAEPTSTLAQPATTQPSIAGIASPPTTAGSSAGAAPASIAPAGLSVVPATQPSAITLGSTQRLNPVYPLGLNLVPQGAGISSVVLNEFRESVRRNDPYVFQRPSELDEGASRPLATRSVTVNGATLQIPNVAWTLFSSDTESASYALDLASPTGPLVRIIKSYRVFPRSEKEQGFGYEVLLTQRFENLTDQPMEVSTVLNGPATPPRELDRGSDRSIVGGYDNGSGAVHLAHHFIEEFSAKQPSRDYTRAEKYEYPLLWAGASSVYFNAILRPEPLDPKAGQSPKHIEKVEASTLNPSAPANQQAIVLAFTSKPLRLAPRGSAETSARAFFGPKRRSLLTETFFALFPRAYDLTLVMTSGICAICTFQWLINILVVMLKGFYFVVRDWGIAIILLVFVVRLLLHPITKSSQKSMVKMGKMGPEIERLKKKYGDDKDGLNKEMMQFYKQNGVTPILGCLPMFLQMPIWIALWSALQSTFELRHAPFLYGFTWIKDLAQPDHLIELSQPINLFGFIPVSGLNVLPFLLAGVFWLQQKYTPKPPTTTPEQEQQQKIMQWMTLLFPVMLYGGPSGLNLYILASTTFGIIESKIIRDHIKRDDDRAKGDRVIIDAPQTRAGRHGPQHGKRPSDDKPEPKQRGGLAGWWAMLQEKAEQVQKETQRRGRS